MIAKENNCVVSACDGCVKSIVDRLSLLPEYPENIDYVFNSFCYCYENIWSLFTGMDALNKWSRRTLIQYLNSYSPYSAVCRRDICNKCMKCFIMSLKGFLMPYIIDEY